MTRTSHNSPVCLMMNTMKQSRKNGGGGNYPQWMRTLEEKYQKLHKKIAENTSVGYGRFNSCVGRSVYDARLSQALLRYRDQAFQKTSIRSKSTTTEPATNNVKQETDLCGDDKIETAQDQYLDNEIDLTNNNNGEQNCEKIVKDGTVLEDCSSGVIVTDLNQNQVLRLHDDDCSLEDYTENENTEVEEICGNKHGIASEETDARKSDKPCDERNNNLTEEGHRLETNTNNQNSRRYLKTSVSRTSKITTKSCPAKLQNKTTLEKGNQKRLLNSRSKSANRNEKMFTPMSAEAKHAITETIHEMNLTTSVEKGRPDTVDFIPSRGRKCVKTWGMPRKTKQLFAVTRATNASPCLDELHSDGVILRDRHSVVDEDKVSCLSSAGSLNEQKSNSRLPDILAGSIRERSSARNSSYRLPGIGKYNIAHDDPVFEITPLGFDSRYNDVLVVEERESETPPPDIRQRAIEKCSEWLTKYNK